MVLTFKCILCMAREQIPGRPILSKVKNDWSWSSPIRRLGDISEYSFSEGELSHDPLDLQKDPQEGHTLDTYVSLHDLGQGNDYALHSFEPLLTMFTHPDIRNLVHDNSDGYSKLFVDAEFEDDNEAEVAEIIINEPSEIEDGCPHDWTRASRITTNHTPENWSFILQHRAHNDPPSENKHLRMHRQCMQVLLNQILGKQLNAPVTMEEWMEKIDHKALVATLYSFDNWEYTAEECSVGYAEDGSAPSLIAFYEAVIIGPSETSPMDYALRHAIYNTNRFTDKSLPIVPIPIPNARYDPFLVLPFDICLEIVDFLVDIPDIKNAYHSSPALATVILRRGFWLHFLRQHTAEFLPELNPYLQAPESLSHVDLRKLAGWAEVVSRSRCHYHGWGMTLSARRNLLQRNKRVVERYQAYVAGGLKTLEAPCRAYTSDYAIILFHNMQHSTWHREWDKDINLSSISISLVPYLQPGAPDRILRIRTGNYTPVMELIPVWDKRLIGTADYPKEAIIKADETVVTIEFEIGFLMKTVIEERHDRYVVIGIRIIGNKGNIAVARIPGWEVYVPTFYQYIQDAHGILFLEQMACPFRWNCNMKWDWSETRMCGFRIITQPPAGTPVLIEKNAISKLSWAHSFSEPGYHQPEWINSGLILEPERSDWHAVEDQIPTPLTEAICIEEIGPRGLSGRPSTWRFFTMPRYGETIPYDRSQFLKWTKPVACIVGIELLAEQDGAWEHQIIGITEDQAKEWPQDYIYQITVDPQMSAICALDYNNFLKITHRDGTEVKVGGEPHFLAGIPNSPMAGPPAEFTLFDEERAFCGFALALRTEFEDFYCDTVPIQLEKYVRERVRHYESTQRVVLPPITEEEVSQSSWAHTSEGQQDTYMEDIEAYMVIETAKAELEQMNNLVDQVQGISDFIDAIKDGRTEADEKTWNLVRNHPVVSAKDYPEVARHEVSSRYFQNLVGYFQGPLGKMWVMKRKWGQEEEQGI